MSGAGKLVRKTDGLTCIPANDRESAFRSTRRTSLRELRSIRLADGRGVVAVVVTSGGGAMSCGDLRFLGDTIATASVSTSDSDSESESECEEFDENPFDVMLLIT